MVSAQTPGFFNTKMFLPGSGLCCGFAACRIAQCTALAWSLKTQLQLNGHHDLLPGIVRFDRLRTRSQCAGASNTPRIWYVSDSIFLPSRLTAQLSFASFPENSPSECSPR